jgi:hypothetical protein
MVLRANRIFEEVLEDCPDIPTELEDEIRQYLKDSK